RQQPAARQPGLRQADRRCSERSRPFCQRRTALMNQDRGGRLLLPMVRRLPLGYTRSSGRGDRVLPSKRSSNGPNLLFAKTLYPLGYGVGPIEKVARQADAVISAGTTRQNRSAPRSGTRCAGYRPCRTLRPPFSETSRRGPTPLLPAPPSSLSPRRRTSL